MTVLPTDHNRAWLPFSELFAKAREKRSKTTVELFRRFICKARHASLCFRFERNACPFVSIMRVFEAVEGSMSRIRLDASIDH